MRLQSIKLAGFKSFVDPTTVPFQSNMTAVVGPNGCGKSNIIDAVRWVMGESSAKHLRGESMADVIFNGSVSRKPVSRASIELIFNNSEGRAGGEFAKFNEISVRREVTRDGQSKYFLNGSACRRRDVTDLFLGTGLGPRSYAIIEQGMIARIIEAKPEELRTYVEEAAGVSKYKERRRETENRMSRTRENLERLHDLSDELSRQLDRLKRQADAAERFKALRAEARQLEALVDWYALQVVNEQAATHQEHLNDKTRQLDRLNSELSTNERARIDAQVARDQANQTLDAANAAYYAHAAKLSRLETERTQHENQLQETQQSKRRVDAALEQLADQLKADQAEGAEASKRKAEVAPQLTHLDSALSEVNAAIERHETQLAATDLKRGHLAQELGRIKSELTRLATEKEGLTRQHKLEVARLADVQTTLANLADTDPTLLNTLRDQLSRKESEVHEAVQSVADRETAYEVAQEAFDHAQDASHQALAATQAVEAEIAKTQRILDAETRVDDQLIDQWIRNQPGVGGRAMSEISVPVSERAAFEAAYPEWLSAFVVERLDALDIESLPPGVRLVERAALNQVVERLSYCPKYAADGGEGYSADGLKFGAGWIERVVGEATGILDLTAALPELKERGETAQQHATACEADRSAAEAVRVDALNQLKQAQAELNRVQSEQVQLSHQLLGLESKAKEVQDSRDRLTREQETLASAIAGVDQQTAGLEAQIAEMESKQTDVQEQLNPLYRALEEDKAALQAKRHERDRLNHDRGDLRVEIERLDGQIERVTTQTARVQHQIDTQSEEQHTLQTRLDALAAQPAVTEADLSAAVSESQRLEASLKTARDALNGWDQQLRELESVRLESERARDAVNTAMGELRLKQQAVEIEQKRLQEALKSGGVETATLHELTDRIQSEQAAKEELDRVETRIERLGPINLVALEEYQRELERKAELDHQHAELTDALQTLEDAIRKIDRETRQLFRATFDAMNQSFGEIFPRLFGGGEAWLMLTDEDLLSTGVTIMARPPGKRNSSIYLLSGGEKALTALSLVFAIFQLNPAPFCLLDEVDAPLDDANVGRYAEAVANMAQSVQFIYITHNKIAMERAEQLMGVTMSEPGVSRMVSVDIERAVELAAQEQE